MNSQKAIDALQRVLPPSQFALKGTEEYKTLNTGTYQSGLNIDLLPACIFQPRSAKDVSIFVQTIKPFVLGGDTAFAVVGGGRQPAPGCSNIQDGITLNLGLLTGIVVKDGSVSVGAGERWGRVYDKLGQLGLACSGSRSSKGGIGSIPLIITFQVLDYEVVLASGDIVNANETSNADLWRALRGGGNNFGIVTRYEIRTFEQAPLYGGSIYYQAAEFPNQIEALVSELQKPDASYDTHLMMSLGYAAAFGPAPVGMNQMYYTRAVEKPPVLGPFTSLKTQIGDLNTMRMLSLSEAAGEQHGDVPALQRSAYMNVTVKAHVDTLLSGAEIWRAALDPVKNCEGLICSYTLQPYPKSLLEVSMTKGGNSLGLDPSLGPVVTIALLMYWTSKSDDEVILGAFRTATEKIKQDSMAKGQAVDHIYMNYSFTFQDPIGSYGAENTDKMRRVSKRVDPDGVFQKGVPGGWKLFA
ncbi:hypothetical protein DL764_009155 [Monosporascus ibericus]|uniref:FAD-binding PCMH-type domain-containing protein n=1 Tax=Monosporascus ibericus TaxID=155417 RepID=A0A4Q4SXW0_9PEZI|nr:hypothetical protein DL764_009155 [Monosporascus ibericus]